MYLLAHAIFKANVYSFNYHVLGTLLSDVHASFTCAIMPVVDNLIPIL